MNGNQRWRERKAIFRRPDEQIRTAEYDVVRLDSTTEERAAGRSFVLEHHYSQSFPAARFRFGLFHRGHLVGVAVFSHPTNDRVLTNVFGGKATDSVELGRFVLLDEVPGNGETWFLARCLHQLREQGIKGVVSFSDPVPRTAASGAQVFVGHVGTVYQAGNAAYLGRGKARLLRVLPDGTVLSDRAIQKIRTRDQGWRYAAGQLEKFGAFPLGEHLDSRRWLSVWLPRLTRPLEHPGNHRYAWAVTARERPKSTAAYPKKVQGLV